jgi:xanthosine utilization system XapX-like protein
MKMSTLLLFGAGLVVGYLYCSYTKKGQTPPTPPTA